MYEPWVDQRPDVAQARERQLAARAEFEALADAWSRANWKVSCALNELRFENRERGAESEYIDERSRCEGLVWVRERRHKAKAGVRVSDHQRRNESDAAVWLDGVRAAERAAVAEWPPGLRTLLVRLASAEGRPIDHPGLRGPLPKDAKAARAIRKARLQELKNV